MSKNEHSSSHEPIAIVGVSCLMPGSLDETGFWSDILAGNDLISDVPSTHWLIDDYYDKDPKARDKTYANRGAFLPEVDFDPLAWGVPPSIVPATDTCQLLALIVAQRVLDDATRGQFKDLDKERVSVMLGVTSAQELLGSMVARLQKPIWQKSLRDMGLPESQVQDACDRIASHYVEWQESTFPGVLGNVVAGRIANRLDLHGTNCVTDAACASTFSALSMGVNELRLGEADMVVVGGADTMNDIFMYMCFSKTPALSPSGDCRPFSDKADGTMLGEGIGMVALKRLDMAKANGDRIYGVVHGVGTSSDGRAKSVYAPLPEGQARAVRRAYAQAGYSSSTVELIEAHGTGTKAGDAAEFNGLRLAFEEAPADEKQWCALGSVKSQIGHAKAAAGAAGLVKAVLALHHKTLPPSIKIDAPNPLMELETSPFYLSTEARPWVRGADHPRRVGVSSFGFGGSNFHIAVEEAPQSLGRTSGRKRTAPTELVILGADDAAGLAKACRDLAAAAGSEAGTLRFLARSTQEAYDGSKNARAAVIVSDEADLKAKLEKAAELAAGGESKSAPMIHVGFGKPEGDVAFVFPGQGSQYVAMGGDLAMSHDTAIAAWDRNAEAKLHEVVFPKPVFTDADRKALTATLTETQNAQPAIGLTSLSMLALLQDAGLKPAMTAGHSYGEVTALFAAGAMDEKTFIAASKARGQSMAEAAEASGGGTMLAVSASRDDVEAAVKGIDVVAANHNHPTQVVLSGSVAAIQEAAAKLKEHKLRSTQLPVATAFHSPIVAGAVKPFAERLSKLSISAPKLPVYCNASADVYSGDPKERIAAAIASPVRFVEQVEAMAKAGARTFVEVGPGSVLTGLITRILKGRAHRAISIDRSGRNGLTSLQDALGQLVADGRAMSLSALWTEYEAVEDPRAATKPKLTLKLTGSNYGKPYPPIEGPSALPKPNPEREPEVRLVEKVVEKIVEVPVERVVEKIVEKIVEVPVERVVEKIVEVPVGSPMQGSPMQGQTGGDNGQAWLSAFAYGQQQTLQAHQAFQQAMAQSHQAFLQASQTSVFGMSSMANPSLPAGQMMPTQAMPSQHALPSQHYPQHEHAPTHMPQTLVSYPAPDRAPAPSAAPTARRPAPAPRAATAAPAAAALSPAAPAPTPAARVAPVKVAPTVVAAPTPSGAHTPRAVTTPAIQTTDLRAALLAVVSEKTGYPPEMLDLNMDMEADLGIDSIKRVEILSAMKEQVPGLPEVDAADLSKTRTLAEIVGIYEPLLGAAMPQSAPMPESASMPESAESIAPTGSYAAVGRGPSVDALRGVLLSVVADKTGYPADMLNLDMDMEADLGIDSIKRVEILSAMKEQVDDLPEVDAADLSKTRTLAEIVGIYEPLLGKADAASAAHIPAAAPIPSTSASTNVAPSTGADSGTLRAVLLSVVADKTGYPADMLNLDMDMEADLGIDSIKRVEILSAMKEQVPGLPEVGAAELAKTRTLAEIVGIYAPLLEGVAGGDAAASDVAAASAAPDTSSDVGRFVTELVEAPASGFAIHGFASSEYVAIVPDDQGIAEALAALLRERGQEVEVTSTPNSKAQTLLFLGGLRKVPDVASARSIQREAFRAAREFTKNQDGRVFVTVQDTGGGFALRDAERLGARAWLGGLAGLTKTAELEWPEVSCRAIDLATENRDAKTLAARLMEELLGGGHESEVALAADGRRFTVRVREEVAVPMRAPLPAGAVVIASGGARGVTASSLVAFAAASRCKLVLLGRTPLTPEPSSLADAADLGAIMQKLMEEARANNAPLDPKKLRGDAQRILAGREVRSTLESIVAAGGDARYVATDVQDVQALRSALADVRKDWGPISGIVHGAGVLADKLIAEKSDADFDRVFDTKVLGLDALLRATAEDPILLLCSFSSVAGRAGNVGQSDYAMANEVLNKVSAYEGASRKARGLPFVAKSIGWGPWAGGMVTPALKKHFESMGVPLIPIEGGAKAFVNELAYPGDVEIVVGASPDAWKGTKKEDEALYEVVVDKSRHAFLSSHRVKGQVVVPVVLVLEWFTRAAQLHRPSERVVRCYDVKVLNGLKLEGFDEGKASAFAIYVKQLRNGNGSVLSAELRDLSGRACYRATVELVVPGNEPKAHLVADLADLLPLEGQVYGDVLFHGSEFQVIRGIEGVSDAGASATMLGARSMGWPGADGNEWQTDAALLDGGLQLALLWTSKALGGHSLPTGVESLTLHQRGLPYGPTRVELRAREASGDKGVCDVTFTSGDGEPIAELRGVTTHVLPGTR